jgi:hypothetical protein
MKRSVVVIFILLISFYSGNLVAQEKDFGLGIILGEPTGISFKNWIGSTTAIDGGIAWSFSKNSSLHLHVDYLFHNFNIFKAKNSNLALYYGIGGRVKTEKESQVGVRIPVGINYIFGDAPLDIFFELVPVLDLMPSTEFELTGGVGIRYYF